MTGSLCECGAPRCEREGCQDKPTPRPSALKREPDASTSLCECLRQIVTLHEIEVAQRHKPISWWREQYGQDWVLPSTKARRELDAAIYEAKADLLDNYGESLPDGVTTEAFAEADLLRRRAEELRAGG